MRYPRIVATTAGVLAEKLYLWPGVAVGDSWVIAIIYTIINVTLSAGASVRAVTVNLPSPETSA